MSQALRICFSGNDGASWRDESLPVLSRLANWAAGLDASALDDEVVHAATRGIVDTAGVALAGARTSTCQNVRRVVESETQSGGATMLAGGVSRKASGAALANGTAAHLLDFDDTHFDGIVHASCVVFPAVLACAEENGATTADVLAAFVAGSEVTYALGRALPDIFWQGWWTTATLGSIGAAAGAARAMRMDAAATAHALAIAASFTFGMRTILGNDANPLGAGIAAQAGVRAALLAREGVQGALNTVEHPVGLAAVFNNKRLDASRISELGRHYALVSPGLAFKLFPACSGAQAASQAMSELVASEGLRGDRIARVVCRVAPLVAENLRYPDPANLTQAQFSLPFAIGCQIAAGRFGVAQLTDEFLHSPALRAAMAKVEMQRAEDLAPPAQKHLYPEAAEVTCVLSDGRRVMRTVLAARGMPSDPQSDDDLRAKFMECATSLLPQQAVDQIYDQLQTLKSLRPATDVFRALREQGNLS